MKTNTEFGGQCKMSPSPDRVSSGLVLSSLAATIKPLFLNCAPPHAPHRMMFGLRRLGACANRTVLCNVVESAICGQARDQTQAQEITATITACMSRSLCCAPKGSSELQRRHQD